MPKRRAAAPPPKIERSQPFPHPYTRALPLLGPPPLPAGPPPPPRERALTDEDWLTWFERIASSFIDESDPAARPPGVSVPGCLFAAWGIELARRLGRFDPRWQWVAIKEMQGLAFSYLFYAERLSPADRERWRLKALEELKQNTARLRKPHSTAKLTGVGATDRAHLFVRRMLADVAPEAKVTGDRPRRGYASSRTALEAYMDVFYPPRRAGRPKKTRPIPP